MKQLFWLVLLFVLLPVLSACEKSRIEKETELLQKYLVENNIEAEPTSSGIYYIEVLKGSGPSPKGGDQVTVKYKGYFVDGEVFNEGEFTFPLGYGYVIAGWDEGIRYMNEGGKALLIIPSQMGYGAEGRDDIPGYTTLIFEVELISIL